MVTKERPTRQSEKALTGAERRILEALVASQEQLTRRDILQQTGLSDKGARLALAALLERGAVSFTQAERKTLYYQETDLGRTLVADSGTPHRYLTLVLDSGTPASTSLDSNVGTYTSITTSYSESTNVDYQSRVPESYPTAEATPVTDNLADMTFAQMQDAVIDAWCRGGKLPLLQHEDRGPSYRAAGLIVQMLKRGACTLQDVERCTREMVPDEETRRKPWFWSIQAVARHLPAWAAANRRKKPAYIDPPAGWTSGLDPETGLHRIWDHQKGCEVQVEYALDPIPQRDLPPIGKPYVPLGPNEVITKDPNREMLIRDFYVTSGSIKSRFQMTTDADGHVTIIDTEEGQPDVC